MCVIPVGVRLSFGGARRASEGISDFAILSMFCAGRPSQLCSLPLPGAATWTDVVVQWCSQGDLLAVAGMERTLLSADPSCPPMTRNAIVKFYNVRGEHIYTLDTPAQVTNAVAAGPQKRVCNQRKITALNPAFCAIQLV